MALLMVTGIILATVVPTIESISNARSMKVQVNSKDEKPLIDGENYSFTSQTKRHDHKVDWTFKFTKNKSDEAEQFSLVLNENQEDFTEFDDFSINGNDLAVPDMKKSIEKLEADEQEDLEELEQDDDEAREAAQHGELTWQEVPIDDEDTEKVDEDAKPVTDGPKYQLVYTTAEPTKQAEELEISFSTPLQDGPYKYNAEVNLEVQPHLVAGMTEKLPLGSDDDKKLAKNARSYELTVDAKHTVEAPNGIKEAQATVAAFNNETPLPEGKTEVTDAEKPTGTQDKQIEETIEPERSDDVETVTESAQSKKASTRSALDTTQAQAQFDPTKYKFTTTGGTATTASTLQTTTIPWTNPNDPKDKNDQTIEVSQIKISRDSRSTNWEHFNAWSNVQTLGGTIARTFNGNGAPTANLQIYQKYNSYGFNGNAPNQNLRNYTNGEFFGDAVTVTGARTDATRTGYLFEFNMNPANAEPDWAKGLKLYVQYGNVGNYYTAEAPEGLPMGALITYSDFSFGNNGDGNRTTGFTSTATQGAIHPTVDVSNSLMGGFMMDGIRDMRVQIQYFSIDPITGEFDKLLDIVPVDKNAKPELKSWFSIGPLVNHSSANGALNTSAANRYIKAEAVSKITDTDNFDLKTEESIGSLMIQIPESDTTYGGMWTSVTDNWRNKIGMLDFEYQAIAFEVIGTSNQFRFRNGNGYLLKSFSTSFVRPVDTEQPKKTVTRTTSITANELDANDPDNDPFVRLNDGETTTTTNITYEYDDNPVKNNIQTRTLDGGSTNNTQTWFGLGTIYPSGLNIRRTRTNTATTIQRFNGGTVANPVGQTAINTGTEGFGAVVWNRYSGSNKAIGNALITNATGNIPVYGDTRRRQLAVNGDWALYPDGSYVRKVDGKIYQGQLRNGYFNSQQTLQTNMPGYNGAVVAPYISGTLPYALVQFEMQILPSNLGTSYGIYTTRIDTETSTTNKIYEATQAADGTYSKNQTAKVHYYDVAQPVYHIPNDSVTKPREIIFEDTLPVGIKPNILTTGFRDNSYTWEYNNAQPESSFSLWNTDGQRMTFTKAVPTSPATTITRSNITVTLENGQYKLRWALTKDEITELTFNGGEITFRIPVTVDVDNPQIRAIREGSPYPSFAMLNQARTYFKTDSPGNASRAFSWDGRTNLVKTQIRFGDFASDEKFIDLGIKKIWDDPTNSTPSQMTATGMTMVQKAKESQPIYLDFKLFQKIGDGPVEDTGQVYRLNKPGPGIYQWPVYTIPRLTNKTPPVDGKQETITYSLREVQPANFSEATAKQRHLQHQDENETRPEFNGNNLSDYYEFTNKPMVEINGKKTWNENGDTSVTHHSLTVYLTVDRIKQLTTTKIASPTTDWTYKFINQPRFGFVDINNNGKQDNDEPWHEYNYGVTEDQMLNYTNLPDLRETNYENGNTTHNMVNDNRFIPEKIPIDGSKQWADTDNIDGRRPEKLGLTLMRSKIDGSALTWVSKYVTDQYGGDRDSLTANNANRLATDIKLSVRNFSNISGTGWTGRTNFIAAPNANSQYIYTTTMGVIPVATNITNTGSGNSRTWTITTNGQYITLPPLTPGGKSTTISKENGVIYADGPIEPWKFDFGSKDAILNTSVLRNEEVQQAFNDRLFNKDYNNDGDNENYSFDIDEFTYDSNGAEINRVPGYHRGMTRMTLVEFGTPKQGERQAWSYRFELTNTSDPTTDITKRKTVKINITSDEKDSTPLTDSTFELYQWSKETKTWIYIGEKISDSNGDLSFTNLGAGTNNPESNPTGNDGNGAARAARDNGTQYRLRQTSAPIGYQVPNYEIEFELVYNMAVAANQGGTGVAIAAKAFTVLRNASMKVFTGTDLSNNPGQGTAMANSLRNTETTNFVTIDNINRAVVLDLNYNVGNTHNVGNPAVTSIYGGTGYTNDANYIEDGITYPYYNGAINPNNGTKPNTTQNLAISNHIDKEIRIEIKNTRRHMPLPTTGGLGSSLIVIGALGLLGIYGWRTWQVKRGSADE